MTARKNFDDGAETSGPKRFTMVKPFEFRGQRYDTLTAREPKVMDLRKFLRSVDGDPIYAIETTLADLCGVDEPVMGNMSIKDFGLMKQWFEGFLSDLTPDSQH